jgi:hypothetical protein
MVGANFKDRAISGRFGLMLVEQLALQTEGLVTVNIAGHAVTLDLASPHERRYAACALATNLQYPQHDIDLLLFGASCKTAMPCSTPGPISY